MENCQLALPSGYSSGMADTRNDYGVLLAAPLMGATTVFRAGAGYLGVWSSRAPQLMRLSLDACMRAPGHEEGSLQQELVAFARESTDVVVEEVRRGIDDLEAYGGPSSPGRR